MFSASIADFTTALKIEPYNVRGRFSFGRLLYELENFEEAIDHLQKGKNFKNPVF